MASLAVAVAAAVGGIVELAAAEPDVTASEPAAFAPASAAEPEPSAPSSRAALVRRALPQPVALRRPSWSSVAASAAAFVEAAVATVELTADLERGPALIAVPAPPVAAEAWHCLAAAAPCCPSSGRVYRCQRRLDPSFAVKVQAAEAAEGACPLELRRLRPSFASWQPAVSYQVAYRKVVLALAGSPSSRP